MRILFVSASRAFTAEIEQSLFLATQLSARGHACRWIGPPGAASLARAQTAGLSAVAFRGADFKRSPGQWVGHCRTLVGELRRFQPNVVLTVESPAHLLSAIAIRLAGARGRVALVRWRGTAVRLRRRPLSGRLYNRETALVLAPCERLVRDAGNAGFLTAHWRVVDGGVDLERFAPAVPPDADWVEAGIPRGAPVLALVARLAPVKGVDHFLAALSLLRRDHPDVHALVLGEAWEGEAEKFHSALGRLGLEGYAHWLGRREDVPRWLRLARVGVVSSLGSEMHSRAALEYMATGLPVVATRVGVLPEWLEGRSFAKLVPAADSKALATALHEMLAAPDPVRLGCEARAEAERRFSPLHFVELLERVLLEHVP